MESPEKASLKKKKTLKIKPIYFKGKTVSTVKNGTVMITDAECRNLYIGGQKVKCFKGEPLPQDVVGQMTKEEKEYWTE